MEIATLPIRTTAVGFWQVVNQRKDDAVFLAKRGGLVAAHESPP